MSAQPPVRFFNLMPLYHEVARCIGRHEPYSHLTVAVPRFLRSPDGVISGIVTDIKEGRGIPNTVDLVIIDGLGELRFGARI